MKHIRLSVSRWCAIHEKHICPICPHHCSLAEGAVGFCRARGNVNGEIKAINYGLLTAVALDPIEKKPLRRFYPGSYILSIGSFGCNLRCPFCQNHTISMATINDVPVRLMQPHEVVTLAHVLQKQGNIGIAYTYNEPLVGYEFVVDCAMLARKHGLKNVLVSNGYCCADPLTNLLPLLDAVNFDLKAFSNEFYQRLSGDLETVKQSIQLAAEYTHVEVTTLVIPHANDSEAEIRALAQWLASISKDIPLHLTRFFPQYHMTDRPPTSIQHLQRLAQIARQSLNYVYLGNC